MVFVLYDWDWYVVIRCFVMCYDVEWVHSDFIAILCEGWTGRIESNRDGWRVEKGNETR